MKYLKFIFKIFLLKLILTFPAYAYLDPGTGSMIIQALIGILATAALFLTNLKIKIKLLFRKIFKKKDQKSDEEQM